MSEEAWRLFLFAVVMAGCVAAVIVGAAVDGTARVVVISAIVAVGVAFVVAWVVRANTGPPLKHADPDSRVAHVAHWADVSTPDPVVRYCPHCGRQRMRITTLDFLPPSPAENRVRCTPWSCEWYDEPSVSAPPK